MDTDQLKHWTGSFGNEYIDRNKYEEWKIEQGKTGFNIILKNIEFNSILEVGSNIGLNLKYISLLYKKVPAIYAIEPNKIAFNEMIANDSIPLKKAWNTSVFHMPIEDEAIDLVFTKGVLIHIAPSDLKKATDEIVRVAKKYVLCIEYFSDRLVKVKYRGKNNLLFKMDYGSHYLDEYKNLRLIKYGFIWKRDLKVFDNLTWWLFGKVQ
jgi:pseudaminic acid biosynthesis-associated methylase